MHASNPRHPLRRWVAAAALTLASCAAMAQPTQIDRIVFFGASLTDTGNSFIWFADPANQHCGTRQNVPPYAALDDLLIPDGPYAKGGHHVTNGATWAEGLARRLALAGNARPAFANPGMKASNYAVGGARAVAGYPCRFNLPDQVGTYLVDFGQTSPRAWMAIEIGANDVRDALQAASEGQSPDPYIGGALAGLGDSVAALYASGARKFLVLNVPDIGKTPAVRSLGPAAVAGGGALSAAYNAALAQLVPYWMQLLPGSDIRILDIHAVLEKIVASPVDYGFVNATEACVTPNEPPFKCAKPDTYVFWDGIHPTKAMHALVAQEAVAAIAAP